MLKRNWIRTIALVLVCLMLATPVFAESSNGQAKGKYKDVGEDFWARAAIEWMTNNGILEGDGNGLFRPLSQISRAEFAVMLVKSLGLELVKPAQPTFKDLPSSHWAYAYVETARPYLTGYVRNGENYFKPSEVSVREDMAVAIVKALKLNVETTGQTVLDSYADNSEISKNLRAYVAVAITQKYMVGSTENGKQLFKPAGLLTRAEAAQLLYNIVKSDEEKVTYDGTGKPAEAFTVTAKSENGKVTLSWPAQKQDDLSYYKITASRTKTAPKYPEDGYALVIDRKATSAVITPGMKYYGGGLEGTLKAGETYYFNVTAVYDDSRISGTGVKVTLPADEKVVDVTTKPAPKVAVVKVDGVWTVKWDVINQTNLDGYKVVVSKSNPNPAYPNDGYMYWITNKLQASATLNASYNGGDFGGSMTAGITYYVSVTALYKDGTKVPGNAVTITY